MSVRHGNVPSNAASSASRTVPNCIRTSFGTSSSTSFRFAHGTITLLALARCAPNTLSWDPPTKGDLGQNVQVEKSDCLKGHAPRLSWQWWAGAHLPVKSDTIAQTCRSFRNLNQQMGQNASVPWRHLHWAHPSSERPQEDASGRLSSRPVSAKALARDPEIIRVRLDPAKRKFRALLYHLKKKSRFSSSNLARMSSGRTSPRKPLSLKCPLPGVAMLSTGIVVPSPIPVTTRP